MDTTPEQFALALGNVVKATAASATRPGEKRVGMYRGKKVKKMALLAHGRELSSSMEGGNCQYFAPIVFVDGNPSVVYSLTNDAMLLLELTVLADTTAIEDERHGYLRVQTASRVAAGG